MPLQWPRWTWTGERDRRPVTGPSPKATTTTTVASNDNAQKDGCNNDSASNRESTPKFDDCDPRAQVSSAVDTNNQPIPASRAVNRDHKGRDPSVSSIAAAPAALPISTAASTQSAQEDNFDSREPTGERSVHDESAPAGSGLRGGDHQADRSSSVDLLSTISSESTDYDFRLDGCHWVNDEAGSGSDSLMKSWSAASSQSEEEALQNRVLTCSDWVDLMHSTEAASGVNAAPGGCPDAGAARTNDASGGVHGRGSGGPRSTGEISVALSHMVS